MPSEMARGCDTRSRAADVSADRHSGEKFAVEASARNFLLAGLGSADRQALSPHLTLFDLPLNEVQYEPDDLIEWVWFPCTAVLSVVTVMHDGRTVESDTVGRESAVGLL